MPAHTDNTMTEATGWSREEVEGPGGSPYAAADNVVQKEDPSTGQVYFENLNTGASGWTREEVAGGSMPGEEWCKPPSAPCPPLL